MILHTVVTGPLEANCYILGCEETNKASMIDPGGDADKIISAIDERGLCPVHILLTHGHCDHIGAAGILKEKYDARIALHKDDEELYLSAPLHAKFFGFEMEAPPPVDHFLEDGEKIRVGGFHLAVVHTPGHSMGSVCFLGKNEAFTGDLIFSGAVGRTDLPGGDDEMLNDSINGKILTLLDDTLIYPGHGLATTVFDEKRRYPFCMDDRKE